MNNLRPTTGKLLIMGCLLLSCLNPFAPELEYTRITSDLMTEQKTPFEVLTNFKYAYTLKDSFIYADLLDSSFIFQYTDPNDDVANRVITWGRDVDLKTTGRLFRSFTTIDLNWGKKNLWELIKENEAELTKTFTLNLSGPAGDYQLSGAAIFSFRKSPYDNRWRLSRWQDGL